MNGRLTDAATLVVAACAVLVTILAIRRELHPDVKATGGATRSAPTLEPNWQTYAKSGHLLGSTDADVSIVEFADFECPFCSRFHTYIDSLRGMGKRINIIYRHFPLPTHKFAVQAVRASECAAEQAQFPSMHSALYAHADSIGVAPWWWFARIAGVVDSIRFETCVRSSSPITALAMDTADGNRLGVKGTPTLLIGPLRVDGLPRFDTLTAYIERAAKRSRSEGAQE